MNLDAVLRSLMQFLSPSSAGRIGTSTVPEWEGWLVLGTLIAVFGGLVWWLYLSPLPAQPELGETASLSVRGRRILAGLVLLSGALFVVGTRWDELWHRLYGGFGDDFLWPPHLMMYGALGLNSAFAGFGLATAGRGGGGLRERFRTNPLVGLLGLIATYQLASIPSDLIWHKIIGPDISAWSLPHALLEVSTSGVLLVGLALALAGRRPRPWRVGGWPEPTEVVALALLLVSSLALLQFGVTEWEWRVGPGLPNGRPLWVYPAVVLAVGVAEAHLALHATRRVGAATTLALSVLMIQAAFVALARAVLPPGPALASHLLLVLPAAALDLWYAARWNRIGEPLTLAVGAALYGLVFLAATLGWLPMLLDYPAFELADLAVLIGPGLLLALALGSGMRATAIWLSTLGTSAAGRAPSTLRPEPAVSR